MARDASQDPRVAAKERMERGGTGLHRGLRVSGRSGRGSGAAAPRDAGRRLQCRRSHKPWSGADLDHESDEKHDRERRQERLSAAKRCRRQQPGAQDRYLVVHVAAGHGNRFGFTWKTGVEFHSSAINNPRSLALDECNVRLAMIADKDNKGLPSPLQRRPWSLDQKLRELGFHAAQR